MLNKLTVIIRRLIIYVYDVPCTLVDKILWRRRVISI